MKKIVEEHGGRDRGGQRAHRRGADPDRTAAHGDRPDRWFGPRDAAAEGTCMSAARILVVDDESEIRGLLKEILADEGYEVDVAADAAEARASRAQHDPDLILLDIWMPDTDGITLLREWAQPNGSVVPGRHDVGSRHRRDGRRGDASRRIRFRREALVARETPAHGRTRARFRPEQTTGGPHARAAVDGAGRQQPRDACTARAGAAGRAARYAGAHHR